MTLKREIEDLQRERRRVLPWERRGIGAVWRRPQLILLAVILAMGAAAPPAPRPRVLMISYAAGFQHEVVRRPSTDRLSTAERAVDELGRRSGRFEVIHLGTRQDLERLTESSMRSFRAILFFTTGMLPIRAEVRHAMFELVRGGGGFIGVHSATDTWSDVPEYGHLVGGVFDGHPWHQKVRVIVEDRAHISTRHLGATFEITDEIYQFRGWSRPGAQVLLRLDPGTVEIGRGHRGDRDYALSWTRVYGRGRVFYTAFGHDPSVWADERFLRHLSGGIEWALGGS